MVPLMRILDNQRTQFFIWSPVCFGLGIFIYFNLAREPSSAELGGIVLASITIMGLNLRLPAEMRVFGWIILLASLGFLNSVWRTHRVEGPVLGWHYYGPIEGTVVALDRSGSNKPRVTLGDVSLKRVPPYKTPRFVRVSLHSEVGVLDPAPGSRLAVTARLSPPSGPAEPGGFDFQRHAFFRGLGAVGYSRAPAMRTGMKTEEGFKSWLFKTRIELSRLIQSRLEGQTGAFASAILTGDRSEIDPDRLRDLRGSNLAHLLAISGLHMGLLTGFVFALVRTGISLVPPLALHLPSKKIAAVVALITALSYLGISGASIATQRAFIMVSVMLLAILLDRPALSLRSVAIAALIILAIKPESLTEAGFQMSFAATSALVACFAALRQSALGGLIHSPRIRFLRPVLSLVMASAIAGAATAPLSAYHFNQFASYGLWANLLSVPIMGSVVMPAAVLAGLLAPLGLAGLPLWVMGKGIDWILYVAEWVTGLDGAVQRIPVGGTWDLPVFIFGALFVMLWRGPYRIVGLAPIALALFLWGSSPRPEMLVADTGRLVGVMTQDGRSLNRHRGSGFVARVWLENDGDGAGQKLAAGKFDQSVDLFDLSIGGQKVTYVWNKKLTVPEIVELCNATDVLLAPTWKKDAPKGCKVIASSDFRDQGAVSFANVDGVLEIKTARQVAGDRAWNRKTKKGR